jgi:homoserine O-acetyltransferase
MSLTERWCQADPALDPPVPSDALARGRGELPLELPLRHGGVASVNLRYEMVGRADAPALFVAGGISAGRHVIACPEYPEVGWWQAQAPSFDIKQFRLLSIDWVGADGLLDRPIDPADQAEAIARLLDALGIERFAGIVGASYGAMVGLHFAALYPARCGAVLAISAAGSAHPFASACRALQRRALSLGDAQEGVALARAMAMLTYRTPQEFADRFAAAPRVENGRVRVAAEDYLDAQGQRHVGRMSAIAYRRLSESIDLHCIDPAELRVPVTLAAVDSDALVPAADIHAFARATKGADFHCIASRFGHDAFLKEDAAIAAILSSFLTSLEPAR